MPPQAFWQGVEEFNQEEFYACHDTLEALWMEASESHRNFYQGILQIAVGCYHLGNFNWRGAVILLGEGIRRLRDYQPDYEGIDIEQLVEESDRLLKNLQQIEPEEVAAFVERLKNGNSEDKNLTCTLPKIVAMQVS
jgi:predicted metal-dependent hydrolase